MGFDDVMVRIGQGVDCTIGRDGGRQHGSFFAEIWAEIGGEQGDPLHVSVLAHSMADVQDDVREELRWDLRALAATGRLTDDRAQQAGVTLPVAGLYPSLHLNLCDCYRKLGDLDRPAIISRRRRPAWTRCRTTTTAA